MSNVDQRDWDAIRADYVAGTTSLKEVAKKHRVPYRSLAEHSSSEGWVEQRAQYRDTAATKFIDIVADRRAASLANLMTASDKLAERLISDMESITSARDVSDVAKALKYAADTLAQVYGILTPAQKHRQKMDEERLAIEKRRLEMEEKDRETAKNPPQVRIVIEAPDGEDELDG